MKRSFKFKFFIQLFITTLLVILCNRFIAQYFITNQIKQQAHQDMGLALHECRDKFGDRDAFLTCFKSKEAGSVVNNVSDFYVFCGKEASPECQGFDKQPDFWKSNSTINASSIEFANGFVDKRFWYAVRFAEHPNGLQLWLSSDDVERLVGKFWNLRDRNLIFVLPSIAILLMLLTLYMTRLTLQPIASIGQRMSDLTANNLEHSSDFLAPYREFDHVADAFNKMRQRLNDSFVSARRFAADASHELRTPLTILRGNIEQLIHDLPTGSDLQVRARSSSDEVERLIEITEKLLLLSRADANSLIKQLSVINISDMLNELVEDARTFNISNLEIRATIEPSISWRCDKTLIHQLIHNLYVNALNYNQTDGWIHFKLTRLQEGFALEVENPTNSVSSEMTHRVFDRFYRGDGVHSRQVDGIGLGLSICAEIAKLHDAKLEFAVTERQTVRVLLTVNK